MRVMIVVPPLFGHVNPTLALGAGLLAAGHEVAWCGYAAALAGRLPSGGTWLALEGAADDAALAATAARGEGLRGAAAFKFLWEDLFFPLSRAMQAGVDAAVQSWRPDVIVHDQQAFAGALAARKAGLPWVTSAATSAQLADPFGALPQLRSWLDDGCDALAAEQGLPPGGANALLSPSAVIAWSTRALVGDVVLPPQTVLVGPARGRREDAADFPWEALDPRRRLVLVTLGTVSGAVGGRFFRVAGEALAGLPDVQGVAVTGEDVPGLLCRPSVPQLALLKRASAVVCHAGHNTVVEALAEGVPLVVAPVRDDQPVVAEQVVAAGAGVRVKFGRVSAEGLRAAVSAALDAPELRAGAARVAASFREVLGVAGAVGVVERVGRG